MTFTQTKAISYSRAVWKRDRVSRKAKHRLVRQRRCQHSTDARKNVRRANRRFRNQHQARRELMSLRPYDCGSHGRFAVPCYIVACESNFNPYADNGSHFGYYQCRYDYECGTRDIAAQHRGAAKLWDGGAGSSHWACA